jgi:branched-chain amino acid transport system ATP-binding protein
MLLEGTQVTLSYGGVRALDGVDVTIQKGEVLGIIGPNGAGKTTLFNAISGLVPLAKGQIVFNGRVLKGMSPHRITKLGIARTFQNVELCRSMTVLQNLLLGQHVRMNGGVIRDGLRLPGASKSEAEAIARADEVLNLLALTPYRDHTASALPFGLQKMIELGRALVAQPSLLLLDEPAAGADVRETQGLAELIRRIRDQFNLSILVVEHDMAFVMGLCQRICVLDFGRKIAEGSAAEIRNNPSVIEAYLGEPALVVRE